MLVDLHTHTSASDGELAPLALLEMQSAAGVGLTAFTDHDTLDGWDRIAAMAAPTWLPNTLPAAAPRVVSVIPRNAPKVELASEAMRTLCNCAGQSSRSSVAAGWPGSRWVVWRATKT